MAEAREVVRIARTDIDGTQPVAKAISGLPGVGDMYGNAVSEVLDVEKDTRIGELDDEKIDEIEQVIKNPDEHGIPAWLRNRRKDRETGEDLHLIGDDLELKQEFDVRRLKEIDSYKGWRHEIGLPVRGQKTKSSFRSGAKIGVSRARLREEAAEAEEEGGSETSEETAEEEE